MATDPFDSDNLSLTPEQIAELTSLQKKQSKLKSRSRTTTPTEFVMLPYERTLRAAGRLRNTQLAVLAELTHLRFRTRKNPVELDNKALAAVGIQRWAKYDALALLEAEGLIRVKRRYKKSPLVMLLW
jgi:hypothetical protein